MLPDTEELKRALDGSTEALLQTLRSVNEDLLNKNANEGAWTIGEIAEHLLVLESFVILAFANAHDTDRPPGLKIEPMRHGLASFEKKYVAPEMVQPARGAKNKQALIEKLSAQRDRFRSMIDTYDLAQSTDMRHPVIGALTRLEWVYFVVFHTERHLAQIKMMLHEEASSA